MILKILEFLGLIFRLNFVHTNTKLKFQSEYTFSYNSIQTLILFKYKTSKLIGKHYSSVMHIVLYKKIRLASFITFFVWLLKKIYIYFFQCCTYKLEYKTQRKTEKSFNVVQRTEVFFKK